MEKVNIKQLAKQLNLSISTVSRALQDSYEISAKTKAKVFELAQKLNYQPNPNARSLREQKTKTIAVIIPEIANNFFSLAINGIEQVAAEKGYHVLIYLTHENQAKEIAFARHVSNGRADGILMSVSCQSDDKSHLLDLNKRNIPLVFFDRVEETLNNVQVTTNDAESSFKATENLIKSGCRRIAYIMISKNATISSRRKQGYTSAIQRYGLPELILDCTDDTDKDQQLIREFIRKEKPDAVLASVEKLATACYYACHDLNIRIPEDMKVIGYSTLQIASLLNPSLTTITPPAFEMGKKAATILFNIIANKFEGSLAGSRIVMESEIIERQSTR
ncbi:LacI family transcriptional regulator [Pedobacter sp. BS3]|uniref:LacI family DNA-binding transcriptional regulator n=1 Tax=Pedobacter sp. BS3 TaxID=2567937 RepID=UPI0011F0773C|nr:LacI family DNA-binding transcriptional regulator [Pedobacter sp. BS3]TZF81776.1 LacI family transcriptional regulator [Pedobacter sp. BS3]